MVLFCLIWCSKYKKLESGDIPEPSVHLKALNKERVQASHSPIYVSSYK
jgi:hypothetical protein